MADYRLIIQRHFRKGRRNLTPQYFFSVLDMGQGEFPANFVCNLPKNGLHKSAFTECIENPMETAISLLNRAREEYSDNDVLQEIDNRLETLKQSQKELQENNSQLC